MKLGIWSYIEKHNVTMVMMAQSIRYRRELLILEKYEIESKLVYYSDEDQSFYLECKFIRNNFVHAIQWTKYRAVARKSVTPVAPTATLPSNILNNCGLKHIVKDISVCPDDIASWIKANNLSSEALRPKKN
jgi:acyl-CoA thioesterase FadM